ncbi:MAG: hypothetical protein ABR568_16320, partial [Pyrinomonadaceae bacterium]
RAVSCKALLCGSLAAMKRRQLLNSRRNYSETMRERIIGRVKIRLAEDASDDHVSFQSLALRINSANIPAPLSQFRIKPIKATQIYQRIGINILRPARPIVDVRTTKIAI